MNTNLLIVTALAATLMSTFGHAAVTVPDPSTITIYSLKALAESGKQEDIDTLNELFNHHGLDRDALPTGYSAGTGAHVFGLESTLQTIIDAIVGESWKGKLFFKGSSKLSQGLNRIKKNPLPFPKSGEIELMANFTTQVLTKDVSVPPLATEVDPGTQFVILNYAHPVTEGHPFAQEEALTEIQVYDVMVPVAGKDGHDVYIGKTWKGTYIDGIFHAENANKLLAWFFLDFSPDAVADQINHGWAPGLTETKRTETPLATNVPQQ